MLQPFHLIIAFPFISFFCALFVITSVIIGIFSVATMRFLFSALSAAFLLYLSQTSSAQEQEPFRNDTISWGTSPSILSKRTVCSGTCAECYGSGSISCGVDDACFNPTIGETCCAEYNYSCSDGYYCAPGGLDMECCVNVSTLYLHCPSALADGKTLYWPEKVS